MLRPEADGTPRYTGRDGAVALTLGGSVPLRDLGLSARRSVRGVAEATVLIGAPVAKCACPSVPATAPRQAGPT